MGVVASGVDGAITFASGYTTKVTSWTVNFAAEDVDTTELGDNWRSRIAGLREWSGTYDAEIDPSAIGSASSGAAGKTLNDLNLGGTAAEATFTYASGSAIHGTIMVTGADFNVAVGSGASTISFTFVGSGPPDITQ